MADPPRRKVVSSSSVPTTSAVTGTGNTTPTTQPRIRAKVDLSSISTPPTRPSLRPTPSSSSSVSSRITTPRPYSPAPQTSQNQDGRRISTPVTPSIHPNQGPIRTSSTPGTSTPVIRAKATPIQRSASSNGSTPTGSSSSVHRLSSTRPPSRASTSTPILLDTERSRPKIKTTPSGLFTPTNQLTRSRSKSPIPSPSLTSPSITPNSAPLAAPSQYVSTPLSASTTSYEQLGSSSSRPRISASPEKLSKALPPHLYSHLSGYVQHPTASAPPSPPVNRPQLPAPSTPTLPALANHRTLPLHPKSIVNDLYANVPSSPELKTIGLPALTPRRGSEMSELVVMSRVPSYGGSGGSGNSEIGIGIRFDDPSSRSGRVSEGNDSIREPDRWSGSTVVERDLDEDMRKLQVENENENAENELDGDEEETTAEVAEEAKINRKIADLEISNASLMAINRSLEATKAKQRAEIIKLRRALRESTEGPLPSHAQGLGIRPLLSPALQSPGVEDVDDEYGSEGVDDQEIEERWEKLQELVISMQKRGDKAVKKGFEEVKVGQRVLAWPEVGEGENGAGDESVDLTPATGTPEG